jgi:hypothetical protein
MNFDHTPLDEALDAMIWQHRDGTIRPAETRDDAKAILAAMLWDTPGWDLDKIAAYLLMHPEDLANRYLAHVNTSAETYNF